MLNTFPVAIIVGTVLGFLAGLGVGGGSLLIIWLTLAVSMPYDQAKIINLLFFLPAALITSLFRKKQGKLPLKKLWPGILAGCLGALGASLLTKNLDLELLQKLFGGLLLLTGIKELFYRPRKPK